MQRGADGKQHMVGSLKGGSGFSFQFKIWQKQGSKNKSIYFKSSPVSEQLKLKFKKKS